jgi:hypothetical protein
MINKNYYTAISCCLLLLQLLNTGCQKKEDIKASIVKPEVELHDALIDANGSRSIRQKVVHLYKDTVYLLSDNFTREAGEQLIIDEGTLIKAKVTGNPIGSIIIKPGGFITAIGTANNPVVFTSNQKAGVQAENWEGITIQGKSFNNAKGSNGVADDFSGVLKYTRIEFAPLVLDAVGNKTVIENVMVSFTNKKVYDQYQAAFNIYGGTFNTRNLISYACGGPADYYITDGYTGNMQNIIACRHPYLGKAGNYPYDFLAGVFIQNNSANPTGAKPYTNPAISNLTVVGPNAQNGTPGVYADTNFRSGALVTTNAACFQIRNSVFLGYPASGWFLNDAGIANYLQSRAVIDFNYSIVHSNSAARVFYLAPGTAGNFTSGDFKNYMTGPFFKNKSFEDAGEFMFMNIVNFDKGPNLLPAPGSPLLTGANFTESNYFNKDFFNKNITYKGALGNDDWTKGWTNFTPLKTNYNFPQ